MRPITFVNITAAVALSGALMMSVLRTAPVVASQLPPAAAAPVAAAPPQTAPAAPLAGYIGEEACATCHTGYDASIKASKHGRRSVVPKPGPYRGGSVGSLAWKWYV